MQDRALWGTRFGFYLAAIGSAFGLGNLWRFPYVVAENGGGAFVLLYTMLALLIGLPLLISELMLGKLSRQSTVRALDRLNSDAHLNGVHFKSGGAVFSVRVLRWLGFSAVLSCLLVLSYYAVISGWVIHFIVNFASSTLSGREFDADQALMVLKDNGWLQVALTSVHILLTVVVVVKGVEEGIEKWIGNLMPVFVVLLAVLLVRSMGLPSASRGFQFLFYPDFAKLSSSSLLHAIGHVCFTLSIGFGTMVTFGSYLKENTHIPSAAFRVTTMDTAISLVAGLLIFPLVLGGAFQFSGPEVLFQTLPRLLQSSGAGSLFGLAFFACLYVAALGASIGLLESVVANLTDLKIFRRRRASWFAGGISLAVAIVPALSTSVFRNFSFMGLSVLQLLDGALINVLLPLIAVVMSYYISRGLSVELQRREFLNDDSIATNKLFSHWLFVLKWLAPCIIGFAFLMSLIGVFKNH